MTEGQIEMQVGGRPATKTLGRDAERVYEGSDAGVSGAVFGA